MTRPATINRDTAVTTPGLKLSGVTVVYRNGVTALKDASFEIPMGTIAALVGVLTCGVGMVLLAPALVGPYVLGLVGMIMAAMATI